MKKAETEHDGMNIKQLAAFLGTSYPVALRLSREKGFPCIAVGRRRIIPKTLLMKWLEAQVQQEA